MEVADKDTIERAMRLRRMMNEMLRGLSPYERACMMSVHLAEMHGQPVDQVAKRVIDDAVQRSNEKWRLERERERLSAGGEQPGGSDQK